jgi:hypothetical protein
MHKFRPSLLVDRDGASPTLEDFETHLNFERKLICGGIEKDKWVGSPAIEI